jgi:glyoxylase-like metal-dependent hydrolase (beta-lactamase superfamily II)
MTDARHFGSYDVSILVDGTYRAPIEHLVHVTREEEAARVARDWGRPTIDVPVNLFLLRGADGPILIDAGAGEAWGPDYGLGRARLAEAGVAPGDVRRVLLTHLHGDHALGLLQGDAPFFPNADVLIPEPEWRFFRDEAARAALPPARRGGFDLATRVLAAYGERARVFAAEDEATPGVKAVPMPGHTPGHSGFQIGEGADALLIVGDALHSAELQPSDPDFGFVYDIEPRLAAASRRTILELSKRANYVVAGGHLDGFMRVEPFGAGWRMSAA